MRATGSEVSVLTNSRLAPFNNFLEQLEMFVKEVLKQRTITKSDEARFLLTEFLEDCISTTYQFTKDAKLIPVRIKWAKEQKEKLYNALLAVSTEKQHEIRAIIKKSLDESQNVLIDTAERHTFTTAISSSDVSLNSKSMRNERRELEETLIRKLNEIIAENLVGSVRMLRATMIETLQRTVQSLEETSPNMEASLESSTSTLVTGFSAKNALQNTEISRSKKLKTSFLFRPLKMGRNFVFRCVLFFLHAKSGTTNNHRTSLSDTYKKALIVVIRTTLKIPKISKSCREKPARKL